MHLKSKSIRTFIGAKNFNESRAFYKELDFKENIISNGMSYFQINEGIGFYLQRYYVKDWVNNSMVFLEVDDVALWLQKIHDLEVTSKYKYVRVTDIKKEDWGEEFFLHDPSGVLWHIGKFYN